MILKSIFLLLLFLNISFAAFQEVRIGKIDKYYASQLSKEQLKAIIDEIEYVFESRLGENIFDYSPTGKPIDIIYLPLSKLEKRILYNIEKIKTTKNKITKFQSFFPPKKEEIEKMKKSLEAKSEKLDKKIEAFNKYIKSVNSKKRISIDEFEKANQYAKKQKYKLNKEIQDLKSQQKYVRKKIETYNRRVQEYNDLTREFNSLNREVEVMNRNFKKVKGRTYGIKEILLKTQYKNGKKVQSKDISTRMNKIEIYGFNTLDELKVVLAHEIAHLVGLPHTVKKGALMNPILQKSQIESLHLTYDDVKLFEQYF